MIKTPNIPQDPTIRISHSAEVRPPANDNWQARRELAEALRALNAAVLTSDVPTEQLQSLAARLRDEATKVEANPRLFGRWSFVERSGLNKSGEQADLLYEMSPAIGQSNAAALPMHIWVEDERVHARVKGDWSREGPFAHLHGGVIALLFDQFLGVAQRSVKSSGRTGTLSIRYHHPTPLNADLCLEAVVTKVDGRKKFMVAELWAGELRTASCEGIFIADKNPA